jgi:hypothetical protein
MRRKMMKTTTKTQTSYGYKVDGETFFAKTLKEAVKKHNGEEPIGKLVYTYFPETKDYEYTHEYHYDGESFSLVYERKEDEMPWLIYRKH